MGGAVASWLELSNPERAVRVRALAGDILLCSWAVLLFAQVYKWVPAILMLGVTLRWTGIPSSPSLMRSMSHLARMQTLPLPS